MQEIVTYILVALCVVAAAWSLWRRRRGGASCCSDRSSKGCGGCTGCKDSQPAGRDKS